MCKIGSPLLSFLLCSLCTPLQYYANKHSDSELRKIISQKINRLPKSNELLNYLLEIGFNNIWTTNYDKLIEKGLEEKVFPIMLYLAIKIWPV